MVWAFFEQVERVARCVPGVKSVDVQGPDRYKVVAAQKMGFISATFELTTEVANRESGRFMEFTSVGKSIAGAVGNLRSRDRVDFEPIAGGTRVRLTSELAVGGMLGALGHKAIAVKSREITEQFAAALRAALVGAPWQSRQRSPRMSTPCNSSIAVHPVGPDLVSGGSRRSRRGLSVQQSRRLWSTGRLFLAQTARPMAISISRFTMCIRIMDDVAIIHAGRRTRVPAAGVEALHRRLERRQGRWSPSPPT